MGPARGRRGVTRRGGEVGAGAKRPPQPRRPARVTAKPSRCGRAVREPRRPARVDQQRRPARSRRLADVGWRSGGGSRAHFLSAVNTDCAVGSGWWAEPPYPPWALHRRGPGGPILGGFWRGSRRGPRTPQNGPEGPEDLCPPGGQGVSGHRPRLGPQGRWRLTGMTRGMPVASPLAWRCKPTPGLEPNRSYPPSTPQAQSTEGSRNLRWPTVSR